MSKRNLHIPNILWLTLVFTLSAETRTILSSPSSLSSCVSLASCLPSFSVLVVQLWYKHFGLHYSGFHHRHTLGLNGPYAALGWLAHRRVRERGRDLCKRVEIARLHRKGLLHYRIEVLGVYILRLVCLAIIEVLRGEDLRRL